MFLDIFLKTPSVCIPSKRLTNAPFPGKDSPGCEPIISVHFEMPSHTSTPSMKIKILKNFLFFYIPCKCLCSLEGIENLCCILLYSQFP